MGEIIRGDRKCSIFKAKITQRLICFGLFDCNGLSIKKRVHFN